MFKEMTYVYAVYQEGSFTKAARKLYISQPGLSAQVKKAEQKIGMPIFDRSTSPITLTDAGRYYVTQAERIMQIQQESEAYFLLSTHEEKNHLRLGGPALYQAYVFPPLVARFTERNPGVKVSWVEARNELLLQKLRSSEIEMFPEVDYLFNDQIDGRVWNEERLLLAVPASFSINSKMEHYRMSWEQIHRKEHLRPDAPEVDLGVFSEESFILMTESNDSYHRSMEMSRRAGFMPKRVSMAAAQMLTAYQLAERGYGVTFVSDQFIMHSTPTERLVFYKLADPSAVRPMYLYFRRNAPLTPVAQSFLDFVLETASISIKL